MNAMDKLSAVVIKQDTRISDEDRVYCQSHQSAYEAAKEALFELTAMYEDITAHQEELLPPKRSKYSSYNGKNNYWELADCMRKILRGVAHFETGLFHHYPYDISKAMERGSRTDPLMEFPCCKKLRHLKMYKSHRVDLKFESRELARQFADEYLGKVC